MKHQGDSAISAPAEQSRDEFVSRLHLETSQLVRDEIRLAHEEFREAARYAAIGVGVSAVADLFVALGAVAMAGAAVAALALVMPGWAAALVVGLALWSGAGVVLLLNRLQIRQANPKAAKPAPESEIRDITEMPLWWNVNNRYVSPPR